jgi:hypothetical protein
MSIHCRISSYFQNFLVTLPSFLAHHYTKRNQGAHYKAQKNASSPQKLVLHIDFAENFTCVSQDEVQPAHWLQSQISLFTACVWNGSQSPSSFVIISDNLTHDKKAVTVNIIHLLRSILSGPCEELHIFSDGPVSHMKNRFMYAVLPNIRQQFHIGRVTWSFFATAHGKGPVDAVGGLSKRLVWKSILSRRTHSVTKATEFFSALNYSTGQISPILSSPVDEEEILSAVNAMDAFSEAPKIHKISQTHFWSFDEHGSSSHRLSPCLAEELSVEIIDLDVSTNDRPLTPPPLAVRLGIQAASPSGYVPLFLPQFPAGAVAKCTIYGRRGRSWIYLCTIIESDDTRVNVKFLNEVAAGVFECPAHPRTSWHAKDNICVISPQPILDICNRYVFAPSFYPL